MKHQTPPLVNVGDNLREIRSKLNLSQADFGKLLQVSTNTIARWERNELSPTGSHRKKVEQLLDFDQMLNGMEALKATINTAGGIAAGAFLIGGLAAMAGALGGARLGFLAPFLKKNSEVMKAIQQGFTKLGKA